MLESRRPGTFAAIYAFEPVMTPVDSSGGRAVPYPPSLERAQVDAYRSLPLKARKRRTRFESLEQAKESLGSKPPFSSFDARALDAYLRFGLKPVAVGAQLAPSPVAVVSTASEPGSAGMDDGTGGSGRAGAAADSVASTRSDAISGVSSGSGLTLACDSETEARVFEAFSPPPDVLPAAVRCPVAVAVGRANASVHSTLVGLAERLAAALPSGRLVRFEGLQHLGPMEDPMAVARSVHQFFSDLASSTSGAVAAATEFSEKQPAATMAVAESQLQSSNASSPAAATAVSRQVIRPGTLVAPARSKL